MFSVAWGVFATAFGWIVATDFRGAAQRFHRLSHAAVPFGDADAPVMGVGFFRLLAGVFALIGPVVLAVGLMDVWSGEAESFGLPPVPVWFAVAEAAVAGVVLWWAWRRSGVLRREWEAGNGLRRAAVAGVTASLVAFVVTLGLGGGTWMMACWLASGLCGLALLLGDRPGKPSGTGPASTDSPAS
ncbi:hypothetical protein L7D48_26925 [Streptomyces sp. S1A]|uniref:hypothetical protein n=1 Tax=Streptomyces sp. ICN903 TaxID=2964654 RepID=UPI001EDBD9F5|nr:hypothetical protein [Streptomyces sp. ICN903]MCG3044169.1 hypothetical protein [Streptomyces sp. ICN903]